MPDLLTVLRDWASLDMAAAAAWATCVEYTRWRNLAKQKENGNA